ncbi:glycosyltransferase [Rhodococcus sp. IEGM 1381]|uniref:glycosyltransferase n=1 Tax=Rhodococcus sp. IEGM 1381 TaxID=3047085 RepID=UPI0024B7FE30|nr:glycosyltransferase [Rhodococcus sp. IEGM 1381]MDI9896926.1 glycosyltransferase [Rhodococcus sp. IEGM 1381]
MIPIRSLRDALRNRAASTLPSGEGGTSSRRILFLDDMVPDPLFGAGYPRAHQIVRTLLDAGHRVEFYPMFATQSHIRRVDALFEGAVRFHPARGARGLRRLLRRKGSTFDLLIISRPTPMRTFLDVGWQPAHGVPRPPVVYDAEAVLVPREKRRRAVYPPAMTDREYSTELAAELALIRTADAVTTVGRADADIVGSELDIPTYVLPHSTVARADSPGYDARRDILFVGRLTGTAEHSPNVDSVRYFVTEVMPALDRLIGDNYRLRLAGLVESEYVEQLASDRIELHGVVEDLSRLYDRCRVFVAPTRYAAGIPIKVIEAMSQGIPCAVTPLLAEQLDVDESTVAIGHDAAGFADACARLYTDPDTWRGVRDGGLAHVRSAYSPTMFHNRVAEVLDAASASRTDPGEIRRRRGGTRS